MADYIEREATVELLRGLGSRDYRREKGTIQDAIKMIQSPAYTPSTDVAPVVRCKDCKYRRKNDENELYCIADDSLSDPWDDEFCSYGKLGE